MTSATATNAGPPSTAACRARGFLPEVQGIRAIAVLLVLAYHLRPNWVPGGYVGVDVFFVISGFLITTMLIREADRTGRFSVAGFYARRARRIVPAATLVLIATAVAGFLLLPVTRLEEMVRQIAASALYVENWYLAQAAVDYLAADNAPSPVQHYWSLSIEEQFYLLWPLLIIGWVALRRRMQPRRADLVMTVAALALTLLSLTCSVVVTATDPGAAYFVLHTRIWELSAGGFLAFALARWSLPAWPRWWLGWVGLGLVATAAFGFTAQTPFPGYWALLPVLGAMALIASGHSGMRVSTYRLLACRPAQFFGDISYSLYLWHWPLIIITAAVAGTEELTWWQVAGVAVAAIGLATLTKIWVEDPVRRARPLASASFPALVMGAACMALTVVVCAVQYVHLLQQRDAPFDPRIHPGAQAMAQNDPHAAILTDRLVPSVAAAHDDIPTVYDDGCHGDFPDTQARPCVYGAQNSPDVTIALVGDSHAAQWVPALQEISTDRNWQVVTYTKSACSFTATPVSREGEAYQECATWNEGVMADLTGRLRPDLVLAANSRNASAHPDPGGDQEEARLLAKGMAQLWDRLRAADIAVVGLVDTPRLGNNTPECLAEHPENPLACARDRATAFDRADPHQPAARLADDPVPVIDLSDLVCDADRCYAVVGNVMTFRDTHHITATFARTAAPTLERELAAVLP